MKCPVQDCKNFPNALYTWGLYPNGNSNKQVPLCKPCADKLYEEINNPVKALLMHFQIEPLKQTMDATIIINTNDGNFIIPAKIIYKEQDKTILSIQHEKTNDLSHPVNKICNHNFSSITLNIQGKEIPSKLIKFDASSHHHILFTLIPIPDTIP